MACGMSVIASKIGGVEDIVSDGADGFLVEEGTQQNVIVEKIRMAQKLKPEDSRQKIVDNFSIEKMVSNYVKAYENFIEQING
jgi:glycosyltransferase involved in cell wall biosynthesis